MTIRGLGRRGRSLGPGGLAIALTFLAVAAAGALVVGPAGLPVGGVLESVLAKVGVFGIHSPLPPYESAIVWQIRAPRIVLGGMVGATLALAGASYQGVFQNPLADPYLLGVASGAGLGATIVIAGGFTSRFLGANPLPLAAFVGALAAVGATYLLGRSGTRAARGSTTRLVLAGVAVSSFLTAIQTFVQQRESPSLQAVYSWILGGFSTASWSQVTLIAPYLAVAGVALLALRRQLDVLAVGDDEARASASTPSASASRSSSRRRWRPRRPYR